MSSSKLALSFRIVQHGQVVREDTLTQGVIKIGKVPSAHLRIDDETVSRMHAILEVTGHEVSLIDLGSTRGTFVNGRKINKAMVQTGDVIQVGETRIELTVGAAQRAPLVIVAPEVVPELPVVAGPPPLPRSTRATPAPVAHAATAPLAAPYAATPVVAPAPLDAAPYAATPVVAPEPLETARSIEVAAMLGDSVVHVKHCIDPRSGVVTPATWAVLAAGLACLLASAIAFGAALRTAGHNRDRFDRWTRVEHKPAYAFRAAQLGPDVDWAAFGGLALGLVGVALAVARIRRERTDPYYRIGTAPGVQLATEHAPAAAFPLVAPAGDDFVFHYGAGMDGELTVDGVTTPLAELAAAGRAHPSATTAGALALAIPHNGKIRARAGHTTFVVSAVARPRRYATPLFAGLERRAVVYAAGSLLAHLGIWAFLQTVPPDATGANIDHPLDEDTTIAIRGTARIEQPPEPPVETQGDDRGDTVDGALPMPLPSGAAGTTSADHEARGKVARVENLDPQRAREEVIREATTSGVLGSAMLMSSIKTLSEAGDFSSGFDTESIPGGLYGTDGMGRGVFGNGVRGWDLGGGCTHEPCGTIPSDGTNVGRLIGGLRKGNTYGLPSNRPFGMPNHAPILPHTSEAVVSGADYSKSIIRRYIQRYKEQLGYCYEKQLLAHPGLAGQVTAQFFIGTGGAVQSSSASGLDPEVAHCIAGVIGNISFPPPRDGGVQVNYPFTFRPTSG